MMFGPIGNLLTIIPLLFSNIAPDVSETTNDVIKISDVAQSSRSQFQKLKTPGQFSYQSSPTIHFTFVPPPQSTSNNDQVSKPSTSTNNKNSVFSNVRETYFSKTSTSEEKGMKPKKTLALYLPGLDGVGISSVYQLDDLSSTFELWRMSIDPDLDRSSFTDLIAMIERFLEEATVKSAEELDVVIIGESFGGLLAPNTVLRILNRNKRKKEHDKKINIKGLVMVNPATSYDDTQWSTFAPLLSSLRHLERQSSSGESDDNKLPTAYSVTGGLVLSQLVPDSNQVGQIVDLILSEYGNRVPDIELLRESFASMSEGFDTVAEMIPAATLDHRITRWLPVGTSVLQNNLSKIDIPSLVLVGSDDKMLPSEQEASRLENEMPHCEKKIVKGAGHFVLDQRVNLTDAILQSHIFPSAEEELNYDPILDWIKPTKKEIEETFDASVKPLRTRTSPVYFSTDKSGKRKKGLSHIPSSNEGPILIVANHQIRKFVCVSGQSVLLLSEGAIRLSSFY